MIEVESLLKRCRKYKNITITGVRVRVRGRVRVRS
jgi:hypothetical protein